MDGLSDDERDELAELQRSLFAPGAETTAREAERYAELRSRSQARADSRRLGGPTEPHPADVAEAEHGEDPIPTPDAAPERDSGEEPFAGRVRAALASVLPRERLWMVSAGALVAVIAVGVGAGVRVASTPHPVQQLVADDVAIEGADPLGASFTAAMRDAGQTAAPDVFAVPGFSSADLYVAEYPDLRCLVVVPDHQPEAGEPSTITSCARPDRTVVLDYVPNALDLVPGQVSDPVDLEHFVRFISREHRVAVWDRMPTDPEAYR